MAMANKKPATPRKIDPPKTFESIVSWVQDKAQQENAPGLIVGVSGTDSILTFLACAEAFKRAGKPDRVLGVHYQHKEPALEEGKIRCVSSDFNWVARDIIPWLQQQAPEAKLEIDTSIPDNDDNKRWGALYSRATRDTSNGQSLKSQFYFPVGARNATEDHLGTYSQASKAVSMLPVVDLYKSEILEVCKYLGVPQIALDKSREPDCDCGRFDVAADYLREVDLYLMWQKGQLAVNALPENMSLEALTKVTKYAVHEMVANQFRDFTPYKPENNLVVTL